MDYVIHIQFTEDDCDLSPQILVLLWRFSKATVNKYPFPWTVPGGLVVRIQCSPIWLISQLLAFIISRDLAFLPSIYSQGFIPTMTNQYSMHSLKPHPYPSLPPFHRSLIWELSDANFSPSKNIQSHLQLNKFSVLF